MLSAISVIQYLNDLEQNLIAAQKETFISTAPENAREKEEVRIILYCEKLSLM
jgi:hypothetical protein